MKFASKFIREQLHPANSIAVATMKLESPLHWRLSAPKGGDGDRYF